MTEMEASRIRNSVLLTYALVLTPAVAVVDGRLSHVKWIAVDLRLLMVRDLIAPLVPGCESPSNINR
jgi:hypothetical protein